MNLSITSTPVYEDKEQAPVRLTVWRIALAVLLGNVLTGITGAVAYFLITH